MRGTVDTHAIGGTVISPEELAVGSRDPDESPRGELHVLALPLEIDRDDRRVGCSRAAPSTSETTATATSPARDARTAGFTWRTGGHLALPNCLARQLVEGHQHPFLGPGSADDLVAINQRRFAEAPLRQAPAQIARQAFLPKDLPSLTCKQDKRRPSPPHRAVPHRPWECNPGPPFLGASLFARKRVRGVTPTAPCHPPRKAPKRFHPRRDCPFRRCARWRWTERCRRRGPWSSLFYICSGADSCRPQIWCGERSLAARRRFAKVRMLTCGNWQTCRQALNWSNSLHELQDA